MVQTKSKVEIRNNMNSRLVYILVRKSSVHSVNCYRTKPILTEKLCSLRHLSSKVPKEPTWKSVDPKDLPKETIVDAKMVEHLERLALVDFNNQAGIDRLNTAIRFADQLHLVDTTGVEPMDTVLEDRELYLREDAVTQGNCKNDILSNAAKTEEDYFVAPPGNIPLKQTGKSYRDGES